MQSELINELAAALSKAQGEMQAAIKDKVNFYKSSYADLGSVWDAARPVLSKYGLCVMQTTELAPDGIKIVLVTILAHTSGQWVKSYLPLNPAKNDCQGVGAAITYLRRYSLSAIVGVVCDEDDDGETAIGKGKTIDAAQQKPDSNIKEKIGKQEISALEELIKKLDEESYKSFLSWIKNTFNATSVSAIPKENFSECIISLNRNIKYLNDKNKQHTEGKSENN